MEHNHTHFFFISTVQETLARLLCTVIHLLLSSFYFQTLAARETTGRNICSIWPLVSHPLSLFCGRASKKHWALSCVFRFELHGMFYHSKRKHGWDHYLTMKDVCSHRHCRIYTQEFITLRVKTYFWQVQRQKWKWAWMVLTDIMKGKN